MPFNEIEITEAQAQQRRRGVSFAARTAEKIRATENCLFSLLPHQELSRRVAGWYEACAEGMLRGNYAPIDEWIRSQLRLAKREGFVGEDLLDLMLICRQSAIVLEGWNEDVLSPIDEVIDEILGTSRPKFASDSENKTALAHNSGVAKTNAADSRVRLHEHGNERRNFDRNRLRLPIRVRGTDERGPMEEITCTQSISRGGLYFVAWKDWHAEQALKITYPYWTDSNSINSEYRAKVVRVDCLSDGARGIAVEFKQSLSRKGD